MFQSNILIGIITKIYPVMTDPNNIGKWKKKQFIVTIPDEKKESVCFNIWNSDIERFNIELNEKVEVSFNVKSKLRKDGKYYTDLNVTNIICRSFKIAESQNNTTPVNLPNPDKIETNNDEDDFPF